MPPSGTATPAAGASATQPVAYDTETLPADPVRAWELIGKANGLGGDGLKPWYLKAHYQTYDAKGKSASKGIFEMYWGKQNQTRVSYTSNSFQQTNYVTPAGNYSTGNSGSLPYPESLILGELMRPVGLWQKAPQSLKFREVKQNKVALSCLEGRIPEAALASSYCVEAPRLVLRAMESDDYRAVYNQPAIFQHHYVAEQIRLLDGTQPVLDLDLEELRTLKASDVSAITPPADATKTWSPPVEQKPDGAAVDAQGSRAARFVGASVLAGNVIAKTPPVYPEDAKRRRAQGIVRIAATIGKDGLIHDAVVVNDPDQALSKAALDAVKQWRYQPYLLNGQPVEVYTTIRVTFALGG